MKVPPRRLLPRSLLRHVLGGIILALMIGAPGPAAAQQVDGPDIVVTGQRLRLTAPPERILDDSDVAAFGSDTVGQLLADIAAEEGDRHEPAFIVNGRLVEGLNSVSDLPAEAIVNIEIYPRGTGASLGANARQRIYSIRLRTRLDMGTAVAARRIATDGGWGSTLGVLTFSHINEQRRVNLSAKLRNEEMLLESERGILQPAPLAPEAGRLRSLLPAAHRLELSLSAADDLTSWLSGALVSRVSISQRRSLLGPAIAAGLSPVPLEQMGNNVIATTDLTLNMQAGRWQLGISANYSHNRSRTSTDRLLSAEPLLLTSFSRSVTDAVSAQLSAFGPLFDLPAGPVILNAEAGIGSDRIAGLSRFQGPDRRNSTSLSNSTFTAALELPITSVARSVLPGIGDLTANLEFSRQQVSDFGSFDNYRLSLLWRPAPALTVNGSISRSVSAPPINALDEPATTTPGFRYFDPLRNETVDVTLITGGSGSLLRQTEETRRLAVNYTPFPRLGLRLSSEYFELRRLNALSELPSPSAFIFAAFPDRFTRDGSGRLVSVDTRPVSFPSRSERQLRTGFILDLPLGRSATGVAAMEEGEDNEAPRSAGSGARLRPRLQISASHSWLIRSDLVAVAGQPSIDLLSREAVGFGGLGQPRHRFDASLRYAQRGLGARLALQSRGPSFIEASGGGANLLRFAPLTTFSASAWVQGERIAPGSRILRGARLSLNLLNITGVRERVADRSGVAPLAYQAAYRDPIGRSVELGIRWSY